MSLAIQRRLFPERRFETLEYAPATAWPSVNRRCGSASHSACSPAQVAPSERASRAGAKAVGERHASSVWRGPLIEEPERLGLAGHGQRAKRDDIASWRGVKLQQRPARQLVAVLADEFRIMAPRSG